MSCIYFSGKNMNLFTATIYGTSTLPAASRFTIESGTLVHTIMSFSTFTTVEIQYIFHWRYLHGYTVSILSGKNIVYKLVHVMLMVSIYLACFCNKLLWQQLRI